jgi:transketolase
MKLTSIRQAFADTIYQLAKNNKNLYVVDIDLKSSFYLNKFAKHFPSRFIEAGISEANAAGIAAGLAKTGKTVFLISFSCFSPAINWAVIKQSICYNQADVKIIGSHSGLMSGDLGATHQMLEDIALMRALPNMEVFSPIDAIETTKIIKAIFRSRRPSYLRLVRPQTPQLLDYRSSFTIGKSAVLKKGKDITIIGHGPILYQAFEAQAKLNLTKPHHSLEIINCSSIKPLDSKTILKSLKKTHRLICLEDHQKNGGLGEAVASLVLSSGVKASFEHLAVDNQFGRSAKDYQKLYKHYNISTDHLITTIKKMI